VFCTVNVVWSPTALGSSVRVGGSLTTALAMKTATDPSSSTVPLKLARSTMLPLPAAGVSK
jgi:hypothetical protein